MAHGALVGEGAAIRGADNMDGGERATEVPDMGPRLHRDVGRVDVVLGTIRLLTQCWSVL